MRERDDRLSGSWRVTTGMSYWLFLSSAWASEWRSREREGTRNELGESRGVPKGEHSRDEDGEAVGKSRERVLLVLSGNDLGVVLSSSADVGERAENLS